MGAPSHAHAGVTGGLGSPQFRSTADAVLHRPYLLRSSGLWLFSAALPKSPSQAALPPPLAPPACVLGLSRPPQDSGLGTAAPALVLSLQSARTCPGELNQRPRTSLSSQSRPPSPVVFLPVPVGRQTSALPASELLRRQGLGVLNKPQSSGLPQHRPLQVKGPHLFPSETCAGRVPSKHRNQRENNCPSVPASCGVCRGRGQGPPSETPTREGASQGKTWRTQWAVPDPQGLERNLPEEPLPLLRRKQEPTTSGGRPGVAQHTKHQVRSL